MDKYTLDANGLLYYLGDVLPRDANEVFQKAAAGEAMIELPAIAAAEALYTVQNRDQIAGQELNATPNDVIDALDTRLPVRVVKLTMAEVRKMIGWMDVFTSQIHDALIVASHEANEREAVISSDPKITDHVETIW
jgi:predicted nucleic acid-binding protein